MTSQNSKDEHKHAYGDKGSFTSSFGSFPTVNFRLPGINGQHHQSRINRMMILVDTSGSMDTNNKLNQAKNVLKSNRFDPSKAKYDYYTFTETASDAMTLESFLQSKAAGGTKIHNALAHMFQIAKNNPYQQNKHLLIITDAEDEITLSTLQGLYKETVNYAKDNHWFFSGSCLLVGGGDCASDLESLFFGSFHSTTNENELDQYLENIVEQNNRIQDVFDELRDTANRMQPTSIFNINAIQETENKLKTLENDIISLSNESSQKLNNIKSDIALLDDCNSNKDKLDQCDDILHRLDLTKIGVNQVLNVIKTILPSIKPSDANQYDQYKNQLDDYNTYITDEHKNVDNISRNVQIISDNIDNTSLQTLCETKTRLERQHNEIQLKLHNLDEIETSFDIFYHKMRLAINAGEYSDRYNDDTKDAAVRLLARVKRLKNQTLQKITTNIDKYAQLITQKTLNASIDSIETDLKTSIAENQINIEGIDNQRINLNSIFQENNEWKDNFDETNVTQYDTKLATHCTYITALEAKLNDIKSNYLLNDNQNQKIIQLKSKITIQKNLIARKREEATKLKLELSTAKEVKALINEIKPQLQRTNSIKTQTHNLKAQITILKDKINDPNYVCVLDNTAQLLQTVNTEVTSLPVKQKIIQDILLEQYDKLKDLLNALPDTVYGTQMKLIVHNQLNSMRIRIQQFEGFKTDLSLINPKYDEMIAKQKRIKNYASTDDALMNLEDAQNEIANARKAREKEQKIKEYVDDLKKIKNNLYVDYIKMIENLGSNLVQNGSCLQTMQISLQKALENIKHKDDSRVTEMVTQIKAYEEKVLQGMTMNDNAKSAANATKNTLIRAYIKMFKMNIEIDSLTEEVEEIRQNTENENENDNDDNQSNSKEEKVKIWIKDTLELPQYITNFIDNGFDDLSEFENLTNDDLKEIGISKLGHRRKILRIIGNL